jgi:hypothetical protein
MTHAVMARFAEDSGGRFIGAQGPAMVCGTRLAQVAAVAAVLVSLAAPAVARDVRIGGAAPLGLGLPGAGSTGADVGIGAGAGAGAGWSGGMDPGAGADGQVTASGAPFQSNAPGGPAALGLDRFSVQGDGRTNVSVFYKVLKSKF